MCGWCEGEGVGGAYLTRLLDDLHTNDLCPIKQPILRERGKTEHVLYIGWGTKERLQTTNAC